MKLPKEVVRWKVSIPSGSSKNFSARPCVLLRTIHGTSSTLGLLYQRGKSLKLWPGFRYNGRPVNIFKTGKAALRHEGSIQNLIYVSDFKTIKIF